ncbi:MAG: hypothetical protein R3186_01425, partial [Ruegeria sp.]|nr:hypothetical protein [Ruegeria sp.]
SPRPVPTSLLAFRPNCCAVARMCARPSLRQPPNQLRWGSRWPTFTRILNTQTVLLRSQANLIASRQQVSSNLVAVYKGLGGG